jgi:branched-chain amino acid transport system substrate-binding protein
MRRKQWIRVMAAGLAASALVVAGCSDDSGSSSDSGEDPGADLTGDPVKVMVMGSFDAFGSDYTQVPEAAGAAADAIEAAGGINGSPIEIIECNHTNENDSADCARQAVDQNVIATVGTFSSFGAQYLSILEEAGIPQVAPYPIDFSDYTAAINYPVFGGALSVTAGMGAELADEGAATINVSYLDIEQGALAADLTEIGTAPRDAEIISETPIPSGTVEFSSLVATATQDDPEGIALLTTTTETPGMLRSLSQSGYEGLIATATSSITPAQLDELGDEVEGILVPSAFLPASFEGNDSVDQFNSEMDEYASEAVRDDSAQNAWLGMHLIAEVLDGQRQMTAQSLTEALDAAGTIDLGMIPPINFEQGVEIPELAPGLELRIFNTSVVYTVIEDGTAVAIDGEFVNVLEG